MRARQPSNARAVVDGANGMLELVVAERAEAFPCCALGEMCIGACSCFTHRAWPAAGGITIVTSKVVFDALDPRIPHGAGVRL